MYRLMAGALDHVTEEWTAVFVSEQNQWNYSPTKKNLKFGLVKIFKYAFYSSLLFSWRLHLFDLK